MDTFAWVLSRNWLLWTVAPVGVRTEAMLLNCSVAGSVICTHWLPWIVCRLSCGRGSDAERGLFVDGGRATWCETGPFFDRWSGWPGGTIGHLCDRVRRKADAKLSVSNEYLSCRFRCIIEPIGFIMNKHTYMKVQQLQYVGLYANNCSLTTVARSMRTLKCIK